MAILTRHSSIKRVRSLGEDMLAEIILRLPVESVARSKCVSKTWCATISDGHLRRRLPLRLSVVYVPDGGNNKAPRFACAGGDGELEDRDLGFFPFLDGAVVSDASNGLLLLRAAGTTRFYVVDPVTRRWAPLPPPSRDPRLSMLAFDPSSSGESGGGFRVVNFTGQWRESGGEVEVFSSESWSWAPPRDVDFGVPAAALSGTMHFHGGAVYALAADPNCVVRMDLADPDLTCAAGELPEPAPAGGCDGRLAHSGGRLHYVAVDGARRVVKVWVLDGSPPALQWRLKHEVRLDGVIAGEGEDDEVVRFLAMHPEKDAVYLAAAAGRVVELDVARKEVTGVWEFGGEGGKKNRVVKAWVVPSSLYLSDCLADAHVQVQR